MVSVSVTVSAESIGQLQFRFRYWAETKMVVSVVHWEVGRTFIDSLMVLFLEFPAQDNLDRIIKIKLIVYEMMH